ncbi:NAD(P)-binding protein [Peniophora sp. CONT]|nr:NAD(P)-binding protein [Peniophora sp. CONT]
MVFALIRRVRLALNPPEATGATETPLRFGILGAANIAPIALVWPVKNHPDAIVAAVAARDQTRANAFAQKHGIAKAYGGSDAYQQLLDDPDIDCIYNPLPNGLHFEWTMKALAAGKHVLLEKPSADTADETRTMFAFAEQKGLILLEAFHYRFHPATRRAKEIIESGEIGDVVDIQANMAMPSGFFKDSDIRFSYGLGGGSFMDMGCYAMSIVRHLSGSNPVQVVSASAETSPKFPRVDIGISAELVLAAPREGAAEIKARTITNFRLPPRFGFIPQWPQFFVHVVGTKGELHYDGFPGAWLWHYITVKTKGAEGKVRERTEKRYGIEGWTTYRYQLEAFIEKLRGKKPFHWFDAEDSIANITWIENVYEATGLGSRPASDFKLPGA